MNNKIKFRNIRDMVDNCGETEIDINIDNFEVLESSNGIKYLKDLSHPSKYCIPYYLDGIATMTEIKHRVTDGVVVCDCYKLGIPLNYTRRKNSDDLDYYMVHSDVPFTVDRDIDTIVCNLDELFEIAKETQVFYKINRESYNLVFNLMTLVGKSETPYEKLGKIINGYAITKIECDDMFNANFNEKKIKKNSLEGTSIF